MEDRDGKKPFVIPKTHTSTKDVLISEKTDSRNVTELFNDIRSCSLELHYDFRQNRWKSCDFIRNPKLQKVYNQKKIQMKKERDPTERFAFHLITSRDEALTIAMEGLQCEQLAFSIEKYLGNPKDGIHLSRRPDVLLASSGAQGLLKFGLLVCKILLGKGYATIPSINNKQLPAQLHYDYHFCKIQAINKEQRHIDDLLGNSLIYCYEHEEFEAQSHPSQILPLAILWYDLTEKFPSELTATSQESQQRKLKNSFQKKPFTKPITSANTNGGTWDEPIQKTPPKYSSQLLIPISSLYTAFCMPPSHSPVIEKVIASETIPLSPPLKRLMNEKNISTKDIPMNSTGELLDPRLKPGKPTHRHICYLESKAVKHALQQQKRLNNYYGSKSKTNYMLIPFDIRSISAEEYERNHLLFKNSSPLSISVIDCFHFGLKKDPDQLYIDLEEGENQLAYEQIQMSDQLIEQEKQLNSKEIHLHLREKRQRKIQEQIQEQKRNELANGKIYIQNGRKLLKEHREINPTKNQLPVELLDFFSSEYRNDDRPYVKRILAELIGIFIEKYGLDHMKMISKPIESREIQSVIDMELGSPYSQALGDRDERFRIPSPPITESICNQPPSSLLLIQANNNIIQPSQNEIPLLEPTVLKNDDMIGSPVKEVNDTIEDDQSKQIIVSNLSMEMEDRVDRSRDDFIQLLANEVLTSKSPSPAESNNEANSDAKISSTRTVTLSSDNHQDSLIIKAAHVDQPEAEEQKEEEPTVKRIKVDLIAPIPSNEETKSLVPPNDDRDYRQDLDERRRQEAILHSHPLSQSNSSHNSAIKQSKLQSPCSTSSNASSSTNHHHGHQRRRRRRNEPNRSCHHQQRNNNPPHPNPPHHQRFNYNHQSVADHPRFAYIDTTSSSPTKNINYNSFSTPNYSQNRNMNSSYYNQSPSDCSYYQDNYNTNYPQPPPLMSAQPLVNYSSDTFERLQSLLEIANPAYSRQQFSRNYPMNSFENSN